MPITVDVGKIKLVWRGIYNAATPYVIDDVVSYDDLTTNSAYICVADSTGNVPSTTGTVDTAYWNLLAEGTSTTSAGTASGNVQFKDGVGFGATSFFTVNTSNFNVGVGTDDPTSKLHVVGQSLISGDVSVGSSVTADSLYVTGIGTITTLDISDSIKFPSVIEQGQLISGTANGTSNIDLENGFVIRFSSNSTATWTHNFRWNSSTSLNTVMANGDSICVLVISPQNNSSYYSANINIDGSGRTEEWQIATPTSGGSSGYDLYTWNIVKVGNNNFLVFASKVNFS